MRAQQTNQPHVHVFEPGLSHEMQLQIMVSADAFVAPLDEPAKWELCLAAASMRVPVVLPPWQHNNVSIHVQDFGAAEGAGAEEGAAGGAAAGGAQAQGLGAVQPKIKSAFKSIGRALFGGEQEEQQQGQEEQQRGQEEQQEGQEEQQQQQDQEEQQQEEGQEAQRRRLQRFSHLKRKQGYQELPREDAALLEAVEMRALAAGERGPAGLPACPLPAGLPGACCTPVQATTLAAPHNSPSPPTPPRAGMHLFFSSTVKSRQAASQNREYVDKAHSSRMVAERVTELLRALYINITKGGPLALQGPGTGAGPGPGAGPACLRAQQWLGSGLRPAGASRLQALRRPGCCRIPRLRRCAAAPC